MSKHDRELLLAFCEWWDEHAVETWQMKPGRPRDEYIDAFLTSHKQLDRSGEYEWHNLASRAEPEAPSPCSCSHCEVERQRDKPPAPPAERACGPIRSSEDHLEEYGDPPVDALVSRYAASHLCPHGCAPGSCAYCDGGSSPEMESEPSPTCPFCGGSRVEMRAGDTPVVPVVWWCEDCDRKVLPCVHAEHVTCANCEERWAKVCTPPAACPECRDRPGHVAVNGQEVACGTCGRTYAPPAPQRYWDVARWGRGGPMWRCCWTEDGESWHALPGVPRRATRAEAESDGVASGLRRLEGGGK